jgi:uncharacterized membrane protein YcjF (UPF0283 family)
MDPSPTLATMPIPLHIREELQRKRLEEHREAERDKRRDYVRTALACWAWCLFGVALIAWSFHSTNEDLARAAFWGGLGIGNAGMIFTLLSAYRRGEDRGDW